jgi:O-antigen ligase
VTTTFERPSSVRGGAHPRPNVMQLVLVILASGALATLVADLGLKELILVVGVAGLIGGALLVRERRLFLLMAMIFSFQFLFHKSFGPIVPDISGGAPSIFVTSIDVMLVVLYGIWIAEGRLVHDLRSALGQRVFFVPLLGIAAAIPSFLVATHVGLAVAELVRMAWMYLLFVYVALRVTTRRDLAFVLGTLFVVAVIQCLVVVLQWRTGSALGLSFLGEQSELGVRTLDDGEIPRPTGTVVHADFLAALVAPIGLLAMSVGLQLRDRPALRALILAVVPIAAAPLVLSQTRAAVVGFGVAVLCLGVWYLHRRLLAWRAVIGTVAVMAFGLVLFWGQIQERIVDNLGTEQFQKEVQSRIELNDLAFAMIADYPIAGVGLNNFEQVQVNYDRYGVIFADHPVHDIYLLITSETGLIGFAGFVASVFVIGAVAVAVMRQPPGLLAGVGAGVAATFVFLGVEELLTFSLRHDMPLALAWLMAGLAVACWRIAEAERRAVAFPVQTHG